MLGFLTATSEYHASAASTQVSAVAVGPVAPARKNCSSMLHTQLMIMCTQLQPMCKPQIRHASKVVVPACAPPPWRIRMQEGGQLQHNAHTCMCMHTNMWVHVRWPRWHPWQACSCRHAQCLASRASASPQLAPSCISHCFLLRRACPPWLQQNMITAGVGMAFCCCIGGSAHN